MLVLSLAVGVGSASAAASRVRVGSPAALPAHARTLGAVSPQTKLDLAIALTPRDPAAMTSLATAVSTPGSSLFRQYLTVSQFAQRFGATDQHVAAVRAALRASGVTVGSLDANHLLLHASGTPSQVEKAFSVSLRQVKLAGGRSGYANTTAPSLAPSVAGAVKTVAGLADLGPVAHPALSLRMRTARAGSSPNTGVHPNIATGGPQPCSSATAIYNMGWGYTGDYLASMYDFSGLYQSGDLGAGETVALFELEGNFHNDVTAFESCYGTSTSVTYQPEDGGPPAPHAYNYDGLETELDIETVAELAPAANIVVYQAPNTDAGLLDNYSAITSNGNIQVMSSSWGECEPYSEQSDVSAENDDFQEAAIQGQSVFASSGDAGSAACAQDDGSPNASDNMLAVLDPSSQPYVTAVGGTALYDPDGSTVGHDPKLWAPGDPQAEAVWNDGQFSNGPSASTGGISQDFAMPSYQSGAPSGLGVVNSYSSGSPCQANAPGATYCRETPDVSADADPNTGYVVDWDGQWGEVGGTSGASPLWAAFTALADATTQCQGETIGFANPSLYATAGSSAYGSDFTDITLANPDSGQANNDPFYNYSPDPNPGVYPLETGYDMATGLGSLIAAPLASSLCAERVPASTSTSVSCLPGTPVIDQASTCTATVMDTSESPTTPTGQVVVTTNQTHNSISGSPCTLSGSGDSASCSVTYNPTVAGVGTNAVTAAYQGDLTHAPSSDSTTVPVVHRSTTTSVSCSPSSVALLQQTTCTATVTDSSPGPVSAPVGSVTFSSAKGDELPGSPCSLAATGTPGVSSCSTGDAPQHGTGSHVIKGRYDGDKLHTPSTGTFTLHVTKASNPTVSAG